MLRTDIAAEQQGKAFARLEHAILEDYSYRDLRSVDWSRRFAAFKVGLCSASSGSDFAQKAAELLSVARDIHLWLRYNGRLVPTHRRCVRRNVSLPLLPKLLAVLGRRNTVVMSGRVSGGAFYLSLRVWPRPPARQLEAAYMVLRQASMALSPIIIDVRANCGGAEPSAAQFAGCFIDRPICYAKHLRRIGGDFSGPVERWFGPNNEHRRYEGKVALLIGPGTVSSCESFALMMRQVPGCKLIGQRTAGASGNPKPVRLGNGVTVFVPSWQDLLPDGTCFEGKGVTPDIEVNSRPETSVNSDPVLAAAISFLHGRN